MRLSASPRTKLGQAMVEMAIVAPVLVLLMLGAADLGRAFYLDIEVTGASRAGVRTAIVAQVTDIGTAVRSEPNSAIPNDVASWGDTWPERHKRLRPQRALSPVRRSLWLPAERVQRDARRLLRGADLRLEQRLMHLRNLGQPAVV
jgi:hypothetical protein